MPSVGPQRSGKSLIELLIVIAIIAILLGLILAAVGRVRESAARARCQNNLRQLGIALHHHYEMYQSFPTNGGWDGSQQIDTTSGGKTFTQVTERVFDYTFTYGIGDPNYSPQNQPGSWAFTILPQIEQSAIYLQRSWMSPVPIFICPSRRKAVASTASNDVNGIYQTGGWAWAHTDYAGNSNVLQSWPTVGTPAKCLNYDAIPDGLSNTILLGEKAMNPSDYNTGTWYWDEPFFLGGSGGTSRGFGTKPGEGTTIVQDNVNMGYAYRYNWGSPHPSGANFLMADGSLRTISYATSTTIVQALLTPNGKEVIPADF